MSIPELGTEKRGANAAASHLKDECFRRQVGPWKLQFAFDRQLLCNKKQKNQKVDAAVKLVDCFPLQRGDVQCNAKIAL